MVVECTGKGPQKITRSWGIDAVRFARHLRDQVALVLIDRYQRQRGASALDGLGIDSLLREEILQFLVAEIPKSAEGLANVSEVEQSVNVEAVKAPGEVSQCLDGRRARPGRFEVRQFVHSIGM